MKKLIAAVVAAITLTMSASADLCSEFNSGGGFYEIENEMYKEFSKFDLTNISSSQKAAKFETADIELKKAGLSSNIEISAINGERITYNAKDMIINLMKFNDYLIQKKENSLSIASPMLEYYTFMFRMSSEKEYELTSPDNSSTSFMVVSYNALNSFNYSETKVNVENFFNPVKYIPAVYIMNMIDSTTPHIGHFDPAFQDFLRNINENNFEGAVKIIEDNFNMYLFVKAAESLCKN